MNTAVIIKAATLNPATNRATHWHHTDKCNFGREYRNYFRNRNENGPAEGKKVYKAKQYQVLGLTAKTDQPHLCP